ncbi:MAG TPA: hypothetical protein VF557_18020 [Jatrophihabitans sp.]|uniref:hypothetical protein n=1 Tax=Jatrophihabitans sp. TaxID=1932789 RepID=UPI002F08C089
MALTLLTVGCAGLGAGCTGSERGPSSAASPSCSAAPGPGFRWPTGIPAGLPMPPGARLSAVQQLESGFTLVTFTTPGTVRANLVQITGALQKAGYTVGRGIAGASETRLPFTRSGNPGVLQMTALDACTTRWQVQA